MRAVDFIACPFVMLSTAPTRQLLGVIH